MLTVRPMPVAGPSKAARPECGLVPKARATRLGDAEIDARRPAGRLAALTEPTTSLLE